MSFCSLIFSIVFVYIFILSSLNLFFVILQYYKNLIVKFWDKNPNSFFKKFLVVYQKIYNKYELNYFFPSNYYQIFQYLSIAPFLIDFWSFFYQRPLLNISNYISMPLQYYSIYLESVLKISSCSRCSFCCSPGGAGGISSVTSEEPLRSSGGQWAAFKVFQRENSSTANQQPLYEETLTSLFWFNTCSRRVGLAGRSPKDPVLCLTMESMLSVLSWDQGKNI